MIHPEPTIKIEPHIARGTFDGFEEETATRPVMVRLTFPNTNYQLHLISTSEISTPVGKTAMGMIQVHARRVDVVGAGGRFIDPVIGRPRRVQGMVVSTDSSAGTITVNAGIPVIVKLTDDRQSPDDFEKGQIVAFGVLAGATFTAES